MSACAIETPIGPLSPQADESAVSAMRFGAGLGGAARHPLR